VASELELRAASDRRLLGIVRTLEPMGPGDLVLAFRRGEILVEHATPQQMQATTAAKRKQKR